MIQDFLHRTPFCLGEGCVLCLLAVRSPEHQAAWGITEGAVEDWLARNQWARGHPGYAGASTKSDLMRSAVTRGGRQQRAGVDLVPCTGCKGNVRLKVPKQATADPRAALASAAQARPSKPDPRSWAVGVTTVPERRTSGLLLASLASLRAAGFDRPRLFVDGLKAEFVPGWIDAFDGLEVTARWPRIRTVGNWLLSAWELLIRNPMAGRFAVFQDDIAACRNLRVYLDTVPWPERGYLNLHTHGPNELAVKGKPDGWHRGHPNNNDPTLQIGYGAAALCFTREGLSACLSSFHMLKKVSDVRPDHKGSTDGKPRTYADGGPRLLGNVRIDGAIVTAMNLAGWSEFVHQPSLVEHTGHDSSMGARRYRAAATFRGEGFDALELLVRNRLR
jgi:hypothetical protein